jgi:hypothetical protein
MTIYTSAMVNQMMMQQTSMFAGQAQYAQTIGMRPMAPPGGLLSTGARQTGMFGEQMASGMAGFAQGAGGVGMAGLGIMGAVTGMPTDPFSAAFTGGTMGYAMGGMGGAALGAAGAALPFYAATAYAGAASRNFMGGMQDQFALNSTLRNNFQHFGGQGPLGRGFSQSQMGQIGGTVASTLRGMPNTSANELNQLIQGGSEMGLMSGTRDVQTFSQNFRRMISTLRNIQRELGGNLTEALEFVRSSQNAGVFGQGSQQAFASQTRGTMATTGMNQQQVLQLSSMGAQMARATGGTGRQGAVGAQRIASQLGAAATSGIISQELLSNATGGLEGSEALQAMTMRTMQMTDRFSRTPAGRYMTFAMSNERGNGIDQETMARIQSGDIGVSEIRRRAQSNVRHMGRARALNQEGFLRGAQMEQGGLAGELGRLRLQLGDRALDSGDEVTRYMLRRRGGMSNDEAEVTTRLLRNQGNIAMSQSITNASASREAGFNREITENRSFDAFTRQLEHGLSEATGMTEARAMGRRFATRVSGMVERGFNAMMGLAEGELTRGQQMSMGRLAAGRASASDLRTVREGFRSSTTSGGSSFDPEGSSLSDRMLHSLGLHSRGSAADMMEGRGNSRFRYHGATTQMDELMRVERAQRGIVDPNSRDSRALEGMVGNDYETMRGISTAQLRAAAAGHGDRWHQYLPGGGEQANAADAYRALHGYAPTASPTVAQAMMGPGGLSAGLDAMFSVTPQDNAIGFLARGGHEGVERRAYAGRTQREANRWASPSQLADSQRRGVQTQHEADRAASYARETEVDEGALRALMGSDDFRTLAQQTLDNEGGLETQRASWTALRDAAQRMEDPEQRRAAMAFTQRMEDSFMKNNGVYGSELRTATEDPRRRAEYLRQRQQTAGDFRSMAGSLEGLEGAEGLAARLTGVSELYATGGASAPEQIQQNLYAFTAESAALTGDRRSALMERLGRSEQGQALSQGIIQYSQRDRDLSGRGRGGARGARSTARGMLTGNTMEEMYFDVNGRDVQGARGFEASMRRDVEGTRSSYVEQMSRLGVGAEGAGQMFDAYRAAASETSTEDGRRVQFSREERERLQKLSASTGIDDASSRHSAEQARAQNPMQAEANRILGEIRDRLPEPGERRTQATNADAQKGFLATIAEHITSLGGVTPDGE